MAHTAATGLAAHAEIKQDALKSLRAAAGYRSARALANELDIPVPTYSRWERNPQSMPLAAAWALAEHLDTTIDAVVGREVPHPELVGIATAIAALEGCTSLAFDLSEYCVSPQAYALAQALKGVIATLEPLKKLA